MYAYHDISLPKSEHLFAYRTITQIIPAYFIASEVKNLAGIPFFHLTSDTTDRCYIDRRRPCPVKGGGQKMELLWVAGRFAKCIILKE
jgi:hypothetical protein